MINEQRSYFALVLLVIGIVVGGGTLYSVYSFQGKPIEKKFESLWRRDMAELIAKKKLPEGFYSLAEIKYFSGDEQAKEWLQKVHPPFEPMEEGKYILEVLLLTWEEGKKLGVVVQYDLVEKKSGNTIWEGGRTFVFDEVKPKGSR